jgi:hypothetical protein
LGVRNDSACFVDNRDHGAELYEITFLSIDVMQLAISGASIWTFTLSVSTSRRASPFCTFSPFAFSL